MAPEEKKPVNPALTKSPAALTEEKTLEFWRANKIFEKTLAKKEAGRAPKGEFVFYEGPPTANAAPAIHHLEARAFKDIIPRYKTMRGFHVARKGGWDTHGLPVEIQVEKKLGLKSKKEVEAYGIEAFNKMCRENVWEQIDLWEKFTSRIGYWIDLENPYITYEKTYMESVWNILKNVSEQKVGGAGGKDLLYKDYKVVPWCPRCGTALSSHELAQGYEDVKDLSVTAKFKVKNPEKLGFSVEAGKNVYLLAWTTTPWTLPGNVALAVGNDVEYVVVKDDAGILILSQPAYLKMGIGGAILGSMKGSQIVDLNLEYEPLYPYLNDKFKNKNPEAFAKAFKVYTADFVTTTDGTGIVHTAVMYGQEDFDLGTKIGLPKFHLVSEDGHFLPEMGMLSGRFVKSEETDIEIIKDLAHRGLLFKKEKYSHSYPHCWRCKTPLIYYARDSWYIRMSSLRDKLVKENASINWEPDHIKEGRFGEWLREVKDWAISRERYWGTPLPIWEAVEEGASKGSHGAGSGEKVFIGSVAELKAHIPKRNNFFTIRHGESEANAKGVISADIKNNDPLTTKGEGEVKKAAKVLKNKKIDVIISSPYLRAKQTAEILAKEIGFAESGGKIIEEARLSEIQAKNWDGKTWKEYTDQFGGVHGRFTKKIDSGENFEEVRARVTAFMYEMDAKYEGKNILIVSHGAPLNLIHLSSLGYSVPEIADHYFETFPENAELQEIDWRNLPHNEKFEIDLHKPFIDKVELREGGVKTGRPLRRVKEVLDVWFDSGAMPFAQNHFPFEGGEKSGGILSGIFGGISGKNGGQNQKLLYPADYISEAIDQTRGWFYTLHAIGVLMGKGAAYKNVICLGHILDTEGKKMSKSLGNIVDPWVMMDKYGVDALRMWMYTVNQPGDSKNFDERSVDDIVKKVFNLGTNIAALYEMYADNSVGAGGGVEASDKSQNVLDRWIIARLNQLVLEGTKNLDTFKVFEAARAIRDFMADFSTWYIRRSRDRFKSENVAERNEALSTTRFVLLELSKYMAPFTPFYAEFLYAKVKAASGKDGGDSESVHLEDWPKAGKVDEKILEEMSEVRRVVSLALEVRAKSGIKIRQPLAALTVKKETLKGKNNLLELVKDELNIKNVSFDPKLAEEVSLDTNISTELKEEGDVRELVRSIQDLRKKEGLNQGDQVVLKISTHTKNQDLIKKYSKEIMKAAGLRDLQYEAVSESEETKFTLIK